MKKYDIDWVKTRLDRNRSKSILKILKEGNGGLHIYAFDGYGVRKVDDLLSDEQLEHISEKIETYLENLLEDTEEMG